MRSYSARIQLVFNSCFARIFLPHLGPGFGGPPAFPLNPFLELTVQGRQSFKENCIFLRGPKWPTPN
jgi:hypothetical protein